MPKSLHLSPEQLKARRAFKLLLKDKVAADSLYNNLPESQSGHIISTDLARYLDTRYRHTPKGQPKDLLPGWDCAWRYAHDRLVREIKDRGNRRVVRFMAGGWAAGKTHALEHTKRSDLAWDGTLGDFPWTVQMVDLALSQGWRVNIAYVYRDIEIALYGAVERAKKEGRSVPLDKLASNHRLVQGTVLELIRRYRTNPSVSFTLIHNTGVKGIKGKSLPISYADLASNGPLHYTKKYERYYGKAALEIENVNPAQKDCG